MEKNRFSKPVAFNRTNTTDQLILKHVARRNFSGYVKKLILADMKQKGIELKEEPISNKVETSSEKLARMKNKLKHGSNDSIN